jgi:hypothetical protein
LAFGFSIATGLQAVVGLAETLPSSFTVFEILIRQFAKPGPPRGYCGGFRGVKTPPAGATPAIPASGAPTYCRIEYSNTINALET